MILTETFNVFFNYEELFSNLGVEAWLQVEHKDFSPGACRRILVNRGTLSNIYGLQVFQDKYFEHFFHQFYFEKENHLLERTKI